MEGLRHGQIGLFAHVEQGRHMVEAGVAAHARGDGQGLVGVVAGPQHHGVERALVQIVEGRIGREGAHHLCAAAGERIGQGQELRRRLADGQHAERRGVDVGGLEGAVLLGEGFLAELVLLLGHGHPHQVLQAQDRLGRMQRRGQDQVEIQILIIGRADGHHGQAARRAGGLQPPRQGAGLRPAAVQIDDRRLDLEVGQGRDARIGPPGGDRAPAEAVEPLGQRTGQSIVSRDDQDTRLDACGHSLHL